MGYCRLLEVIGSRCASTAIFVNAHHSIGMRALLLVWHRGAEAEMAAGSGQRPQTGRVCAHGAGGRLRRGQRADDGDADARRQRLRAQRPEAVHHERGDRGMLTVMARTPVPGSDATAITAFLVTPDMPGFRDRRTADGKAGRPRHGHRASWPSTTCSCRARTFLGQLGKGLKVALTVLDFGRTTFGAVCTGAAKTCLRLASEHARTRRQFGRPLAEFELVQKKLAHMAAWTYGMEAMTTVTAGLIDRGLEDYMLETAMLKVWSTERLWQIVNDAFQIHGGAAYFTDRPLERMLRDHRINQIGEGANEVLLSFIALVGMRGPGLRMKEVADALKRPWRAPGVVWTTS